jgi:hypothetical protein
MALQSIDISVKGQWVSVPALEVDGVTILVRGRAIKVASIHDEAWLDMEVRDPQLCVEALRAQRRLLGLRADLFTFSQKLPSDRPRYDYHAEWDSIAAVRLKDFKSWWEGLPQETRKNVRRAEKRGVVISVRQFSDDVVRGLMELNNDSPIRQGRPNRHYGKSFDEVKRDYSSFLDRSDLVCAYYGEELIGLLKLVYRGDVASILQCLPKASHHDKRPSNALIAKAVELCEIRNISTLTYGMFSYGKRRKSPLLEFKVRNGFEEVLVPRYYVPINAWGAFCLKAGLHRGLAGILPEGVVVAGVLAREKWHTLKVSMSEPGTR